MKCERGGNGVESRRGVDEDETSVQEGPNAGWAVTSPGWDRSEGTRRVLDGEFKVGATICI